MCIVNPVFTDTLTHWDQLMMSVLTGCLIWQVLISNESVCIYLPYPGCGMNQLNKTDVGNFVIEFLCFIMLPDYLDLYI